jgi:hypothetical protein
VKKYYYEKMRTAGGKGKYKNKCKEENQKPET